MTIAEKFYVITGEPKEGDLENLTYGLSNLTSEQVTQVEALVKEHFGFNKIEWMRLPAGTFINSLGEEVAVVAKTMLIADTPTEDFKDRTCYFYSIVYSPVIYDPIDLYKPVKNGMVIFLGRVKQNSRTLYPADIAVSPLLYNPTTLEPSRKVTIEWKPGDLFHNKGIQPITWEDEKTYIREKLETLLANPEDYKPKGRRGLMLRFALDKTQEK